MKLFVQASIVLCLFGFFLPVHEIDVEDDIIRNTGRDILFCDDWYFIDEDLVEGEDISLAMDHWESISLPHDFMITHEFTEQAEAESGYLLGGVGWYRKHFKVDESLNDKHFFIRFEGVYMNASIFINGNYIGFHPNGYNAFTVDLTDFIVADGTSDNVLAVRVETITPNSRWYSGAGIYRDVYLSVLDSVYINEEETIITSPMIEKKDASLNVKYSLSSDQKEDSVTVIGQLLNQEGNLMEEVFSNVSLSNKDKVDASLTFQNHPVHLWSTEDPYLYFIRLRIEGENGILDEKEYTYGYRYYHFDKDTGLSFNGKPMKLQGVCLHHDQGALGSALYETSLRRQLTIMKDMGVNAIRVSHNPSSRLLRELCNEIGFLVIDEAFDTWALPKNHNFNDYSSHFLEVISEENKILYAEVGKTYREYDLKAMVRHGRNDPCIIMWSIGNEILGNIGGDTSAYPYYAEELTNWVLEEDDTRPVTIGDNISMKQNPTAILMNEPIVKSGGIIGFNYASGMNYDVMHANYPDWILYGSETSSSYASRGYYGSFGIHYPTCEIGSYWYDAVEWGSTMDEAWENVVTRDFVAGEFIWTGFDYLGEPEPWNGLTPGRVSGNEYLPRSSYFGVVDTAGFEKDAYYYYQSQWNPNVHTLHLLPIWDESVVRDENGNIRIHVYTDADSIELFLNGISQGRQRFDDEIVTEEGYHLKTQNGSHYLTWSIPYEEGTITAKAYDENGNEIKDTIGRKVLSSFGEANNYKIETNQFISAGKRNLDYVEVTIIDREGNVVENSDAAFTFKLNGQGKLLGTDNGNQRDLTSFQSSTRNAYNGKVLAILQGSDSIGRMKLTVKALNKQKEVFIYTVPDLSEKYKDFYSLIK
ncbi:MAG: glycoside hydrolase family 2 protein [Solobacterium sp.]|nr:glycoside hydrolase family 2 protein [Solobacterium sp.]